MTIKSNLFQWRKVQILSATFFCISLSLVSCRKDTTLGKTALNSSSLLGSSGVDTFALKTYTIEEKEDSVPTKNTQHALLGAYHDPTFGTVNASFYTQLSLDNPGFTSFGTDVTVDSIVLSLQYAGYYGQATAQTFEVYELDADLSAEKDSVYYSGSHRAKKSENLVLGNGIITPQPSTKVVVSGDTLAAQLRIPLKLSLADYLMNGTANYTTQADFRNFFKGIYVKVTNGSPAPGTGGVLYFNLSGLSSRMTIFYKNGTTPKTFSYLMNTDNVDFSHLDFNRAGKPLDQVISNPALGQNQFYAQAFTSRAAIEFPTVSNIPKNSVIHKAQLYLPIEHYTNSLLYPSLLVSIGTRVTATNDTIYSRKDNLVYDDAQKAYVIDVRQHIEQVVSQQIANRGLFIRPTYFSSTVERIIFNGLESNNKKKPKLVVTYTTY